MAADLIVTLDAGTGSGRCVVFDTRGQPVASAQEPLSYRFFSDPNLPMVLPTLLASIALCAVGSLYPAWRAASMSPAEALRRP